MKLAYLTAYDVFNPQTWPKSQTGLCGAGYFLAKTLESQSVCLDYLGPLEKKTSLVTKLKWEFYRRVLHQDYYRWAEPSILKDYAKKIEYKLSQLNSEIILCPESAVSVSQLNCKQPIVLWTDAPLASLISFYPWLSNICQETKKNIYKLEQSAFNRCSLILFSSDWAAAKAIEIYNLSPSKVKVIPWGANIECHRTTNDINQLVQRREENCCKLLFIGVDWLRKGGNVALSLAKKLNQEGTPTELIVVGCQPIMQEALPNYVKVISFIDKSQPEGMREFNQLFAEAHFLILPTLADCSPHVLIEANSFGVPCLSTNVGGIPTIVREGINGKTFSVNADITEYSKYVQSIFTNKEAYKQLALNSFNEYQKRLNWAVAGQSLQQTLRDAL